MIDDHQDKYNPDHYCNDGHPVEKYSAAKKGDQGEQDDPPEPGLEKDIHRSHQCGYGPQKKECPEQE